MCTFFRRINYKYKLRKFKITFFSPMVLRPIVGTTATCAKFYQTSSTYLGSRYAGSQKLLKMTPKIINSNEDDLEYHINFPIPDPFEFCNKEIECNDKHENKHGVQVSKVHRPNSEPVIFLLGWFNSQDRHLAKYSSLYNKLGFITIRYTAPAKDLFGVGHINLKLIAKKLIKLMEDTTLSHHPIIFHNFSNHGSTLYTYISQQMELSSETPLDVAGCIFDSAPSPRRLGAAIKVIYRTTKGSLFYRLLATSFVCVGMCIWKVFSILATLFTGRFPNSAPWSLLQESFRWPQLFLYSTVDDLIPCHDVELFAAERQQLGVKVQMHNFEDSPHVLHYQKYPQEYRKVVNDFINSCLKDHIPKKVANSDII